MLEDRSAIQLLIPDVLNALLSNKIDAKSAAILLSGMRLAAQNADHSNWTVPAKTVEGFERTPEGHELAISEDEMDGRDEFLEGEFAGIDDHGRPELPEPSHGRTYRLTNSTVAPQSAEACPGAGEPASAALLVKAR